MLSSTQFGIDEIDQQIIRLLQKNPNITHTAIANEVARSQPTIGLRIKRLEKAGIIDFQAGLNLRVANMMMARVTIQTKNPSQILKEVKKCPYMLNGFRTSGEKNITVLIANSKMQHLEDIVNEHFRRDPEIEKVEMEIITKVLKDFVLPFKVYADSCECLVKFKT